MKKEYTSPRFIPIGDMVNNTLGASGNGLDNGSFRGGGGYVGNNTTTQNNGVTPTGFNNDGFNNDGFAQ